jgi:hypothetical protein
MQKLDLYMYRNIYKKNFLYQIFHHNLLNNKLKKKTSEIRVIN